MVNKKELPQKQAEELIKVLKARFEKNMNRHKGLEWIKIQAKLEASTENYGRSMKWKEPVVNRILLVLMKRRANTFFMIALQKVLKAAEVYVTTAKDRNQEKNTNRKIMLLIWLHPWVLKS